MKESWEHTKFGGRARPHLPVTVDSVKGQPYTGPREELRPDGFYIAKPKGSYGPFWLRAYHAWLILTNRAMAFQFTVDHLRLAGLPTNPAEYERVAKTTQGNS
ncbi:MULTISPECIES: hypothetical protein [unclassified Variovorax]|uniref:hypothetical protein n=1 Tax=unclassified Variovorax TaxID=663243 RepID=UPI001316F73F|nr:MULTISPECIES: hypothetical protein [unclassified Variovorax]VTU42634.1 hypothetical protein H6P1_00240 [Variovorax sp. PBL-H6]VTU43790.1 hypothetical protein SRS16P1_00663 [Variovorax sp. SRS16]VTU43855.1 hypothetical protein E5P1_00656 [Variovorax sp. PBL-E5]